MRYDKKDDWVQSDLGHEGVVILVSRRSVFVQIRAEVEQSYLGTFPLSEVTKIDPPTESPKG